MNCNYKVVLAGFLFALFFQGCAHPISRELRDGLDPDIKFETLIEDPNLFLGKRVLFGGVIVVTRNLKDGTEIEIVHKNLDSAGYPETGDYSGGRFLFFSKGFLEPEIYFPGRKLVGVGKLTGEKLGKVGDYPYRFPVIEAEELHLLDDVKYNPNYSPFYWDPWYYRSPYWDPWLRSPLYDGPYWPYFYR